MRPYTNQRVSSTEDTVLVENLFQILVSSLSLTPPCLKRLDQLLSRTAFQLRGWAQNSSVQVTALN